MNNKYLCIIQARMGSSRLPGKILMKVDGIPMLAYQLRRLARSKKIGRIVVATSDQVSDDAVEKFCKQAEVDCFRGSENDVLDRFNRCADQYPEYDTIVRITGDCPLVDPQVVDQTIELYQRTGVDYVSNTDPFLFPDGMDVEVFSRTALRVAAESATDPAQREHVTQFIRSNKQFRRGNLTNEQSYSHIRLTLDYPEDFEVIKFIIQHSAPTASYLDYVVLLEQYSEIATLNIKYIPPELLKKSN